MAFDPNPYFRKLILLATHNPLVANLVNTYGMRLGAARFVAGESFEECAPKLRELNKQGFKCNTTILGEAITDEDGVVQYLKTFRLSAAQTRRSHWCPGSARNRS